MLDAAGGLRKVNAPAAARSLRGPVRAFGTRVHGDDAAACEPRLVRARQPYDASMPVVFRHRGFRFFCYSNEGSPREPVHIHAIGDGARGLHWDALDEDVSIDGLLAGVGDLSRRPTVTN
jgi:hypothetical protein